MSRANSSSTLHPLVTQNLVETKKFFCPFLERGFCREASRCNFSHETYNSVKIPTDYCHFYLANQCLYGQDCKFRHSEPLPHPSSATAQSSFASATCSGVNIITTVENGVQSICFADDDLASLFGFEQEAGAEENLLDDEKWSSDQQLNQRSDDSSSSLLDSQRAHSSRDSSIKTTATQDDSYYYDEEPVEDQRHDSRLNASTTMRLKLRTGQSAGASSSSSTLSLASANEIAYKKGHPLCPYSTSDGVCPFPLGRCIYLHGNDCDLCGRPCLHPFDPEQQRQHRDDCLKEHEREMELSFAVQRSKDKVCGICMDTVVEKKPITSSRFGILEKCNHIFCLDCIRKWRGTRQFETRTIRACPECRVSSDFVVPSKYWVEDQDDKEKLIHDYKTALKSKPCRYFDEGKGECPFAGSCFYKHAYPDGRIAKMDPPKPRRKSFGSRLRQTNATVANYILWNILTSAEDDDWSNDELESLYFDPDYPDYVITEDEDEDDYDDDLA